MNVTREQRLEFLKDYVVREFKYNGSIQENTLLAEVGMDSLGIVLFQMAYEDHFGVMVDSDIDSPVTIGDVLDIKHM